MVAILPERDTRSGRTRPATQWQSAECLRQEPRRRPRLTVVVEDRMSAVAEIEPFCNDKRFVQVFVPGRTHEPLGRRKYWPIYEAAAKHGLHIMSHAFGN